MKNKEEVKQQSIECLKENLQASTDGLTSAEASRRLAVYGHNSLHAASRTSALKLLSKQFKNSLIYLLLFACVVSFLLKDLNDGLVIAVILIINTGLGFYQEFKSEKAIEKLQKLVGKEVLVKRDNKELQINERLIVPGDVIILREGDIVPADARLFIVNDFSVNESQLTGESIAVVKSIHSSDALVFAGSVVEQGEAKAIVYATASHTELGKIAHLSVSTSRETQYERSLTSFSGFLIKMTVLMLVLVFVCKLIITHDVSHISSLALFMVALAIAVVPEAMPVIATVTLSSGALKLAKQHVIAKTLSAVEDLGNINILCSDKTGTLTENKQTVKKLIAEDPDLFQRLAMASLESVDDKRKRHQGSFDRALLAFIPAAIQHETAGYTRLEELPFDPKARRRRVVFQDATKTYLVEVGSAETLLALTKFAKIREYMDIISEDGKFGLRHLGIAYKEVQYTSDVDFDILDHEENLKFVGLVSLEDPLRPSAKHTIALANRLGVVIKILSGDSREVTQYVATEVGLIDNTQKVYIGDEIDKMSDLKLAEIVEKNNAFGRLNPEQKYRIINVLKLSGNVVGYQGDGINDAPSLKLADVAIAVNNATDVCRDSADILLLHSDLGVIINGIKYGRGIFANINKYIRYTMIGNFGNFFALSALYLLSADLPLLTTQLLLTNLLGDVPLVAISTDNVEEESLSQPSKYNMHSLIFLSAVLGTYTALFELVFFAVVKNRPLPVAQTSLYLYLTVIGFVVILSVRNRVHFWNAKRLSNALIASFGGVALITFAVVYFKPTQTLFSFAPLSLRMLGLVLLMTGSYFVFLDVIKVWFYREAKSVSD